MTLKAYRKFVGKMNLVFATLIKKCFLYVLTPLYTYLYVYVESAIKLFFLNSKIAYVKLLQFSIGSFTLSTPNFF